MSVGESISLLVGLLELNVPPTPKRIIYIWRRGLRSQEVGEAGAIPNTRLLHSHHQNDIALIRWAAMGDIFNVSLMWRAKSQDRVYNHNV